ncbi:MAG: ribosome biogenesis GTPase Der, partial [Verrucomicrobiota bacterium]
MELQITRNVAIVGRPNVGKSALFNRLAGRKISIVHDQPGVTRDRLATECRLGKTPFTIIDTGGIGSDVDASFTEQVHAEVDIAIATADVILFVVDGQAGVNPVDQDLAKRLRKIDKPLLLIVNKIDHPKHSDLDAEFTRLGFPGILSVSAEHGRGINELVERTEALLPARATNTGSQGSESGPPAAIAIVGRPNVGKSSLINAILHDNRTLVSNISGTTRDAVDVPYSRKEKRYTLIDTAGIRARGKADNSVEIFSAMRSEKSIKRADLCVLVIDASMGITMQDKKIAGLIQEAHKPCVLAINKWDLIKPDEHDRDFLENKIQEIRNDLFFLDYAPVLLLSAKTGENMSRLFRGIEQVREDSRRKIGTGPLNRLIQSILSANPPAIRSGKRFKVLYAT